MIYFGNGEYGDAGRTFSTTKNNKELNNPQGFVNGWTMSGDIFHPVHHSVVRSSFCSAKRLRFVGWEARLLPCWKAGAFLLAAT